MARHQPYCLLVFFFLAQCEPWACLDAQTADFLGGTAEGKSADLFTATPQWNVIVLFCPIKPDCTSVARSSWRTVM